MTPSFQFEELVKKFAALRILVAGDPMYDIYHFGRVDRMCPEAPVPVFVEDQECQTRLGGAANVVQNLKALGCEVDTLFPSGEWVEKHRYMVGGHQLLRVDKDQQYNINWRYIALQMRHISDFAAVVISDYAKGSCTEDNCQTLIEAAHEGEVGRLNPTGKKVPVIVDPKGRDWNKYAGANILCPNHKEFLEDHGPAVAVFDHIIEKRGAGGIRLHDRHGYTDHPAKAKHVFDVTGAGDTVTAVVAAVRAAGGNIVQAVELANMAAAVVVGEVGTSTCTAERLIQEIQNS